MDIPWQTREQHVTRLTNILQAEVTHETALGTERVVMQIKPRVGDYGSVVDGLELVVSVFVPKADERALQRVATLMLEALYE